MEQIFEFLVPHFHILPENRQTSSSCQCWSSRRASAPHSRGPPISNIARPFLDYSRELHEVNFWNPRHCSYKYGTGSHHSLSIPRDDVSPRTSRKKFMEAIAKYDRMVERSIAFVGLHPVNRGNAICVRLENLETGERFELVAKYVVGCDGAHSKVRKAIGVEMVGDQTDHILGVMDIRTRTNFPDIRMRW